MTVLGFDTFFCFCCHWIWETVLFTQLAVSITITSITCLVCSTTYGASKMNEEYIVCSYWILNLMKPKKKNLKVNVNKCFQSWCFQGKLVFLDVVCVAVLNLQNKIIAVSFTAKWLMRTNWWSNNILVIVQIVYTRGCCCLIFFQLASICPDFNVLTQLSCCKRWWL